MRGHSDIVFPMLTISGARSILWRQEAKEEVVKGKGYADTIASSSHSLRDNIYTNISCVR
jgi:hypothetical protein